MSDRGRKTSSGSLQQRENPTFKYILIKLASLCNIACTYCYWFRDATVYQKPKILDIRAEDAFLEKLEAHVLQYNIDYFFILFHGGEPLLFGKERFRRFCQKLRRLEEKLNFELKLAITTNGILVDNEWSDLFRQFRVGVTLSIDGPRSIHDGRRVDFLKDGTFDKVVASLETLRRHDIEPGVLAVCNPDADPAETCKFFVDELRIKAFDILVPDATHEYRPQSIATFYKKLFDLWYDDYSHRGVEIRYIRSIVRGLLGLESHSESIGYGLVTTVTLLTDGSLEPLDILRIAGDGSTRTSFNIFKDELQDIQQDSLWREVRDASLNLAPVCQECVYKQACGGGHIASRWSKTNRWNNPSVYCEDIKQIMHHSWQRMAPDLYLETPERTIPLLQA